MKTVLRYITLLLVSGVIIPFCSYNSIANVALPAISLNASVNNGFTFSFINDVAAKILPVINFFK
jgi:hypothetical protein